MMITLTRLNGQPVTVNAELIETVESTPDTVITLASGKKMVVTETVDVIIEKTLEYKGRIYFYHEHR